MISTWVDWSLEWHGCFSNASSLNSFNLIIPRILKGRLAVEVRMVSLFRTTENQLCWKMTVRGTAYFLKQTRCWFEEVHVFFKKSSGCFLSFQLAVSSHWFQDIYKQERFEYIQIVVDIILRFWVGPSRIYTYLTYDTITLHCIADEDRTEQYNTFRSVPFHCIPLQYTKFQSSTWSADTSHYLQCFFRRPVDRGDFVRS